MICASQQSLGTLMEDNDARRKQTSNKTTYAVGGIEKKEFDYGC